MGNAFIFAQKRQMSTLNIQSSQSVMCDFAHYEANSSHLIRTHVSHEPLLIKCIMGNCHFGARITAFRRHK
jgi:hypothetical protein